jgi:hypothetical protein
MKMNEMSEKKYIYRGVTKDGKTISLPAEQETIEALAKAGGGMYYNDLHRFSFPVKAK